MEEMEVISWTLLDAIKDASTRIIETIGNLDTEEQMSCFCLIEEDYLELHYSALESNYIRHYDDEDELFKQIALRQEELGEADLESVEYYDDEDFSPKEDADDLDGYNIRTEEDEDAF